MNIIYFYTVHARDEETSNRIMSKISCDTAKHCIESYAHIFTSF